MRNFFFILRSKFLYSGGKIFFKYTNFQLFYCCAGGNSNEISRDSVTEYFLDDDFPIENYDEFMAQFFLSFTFDLMKKNGS